MNIIEQHPNLYCNRHQSLQIQAACLHKDCFEWRPCCMQCQCDYHSDHIDYVKTINQLHEKSTQNNKVLSNIQFQFQKSIKQLEKLIEVFRKVNQQLSSNFIQQLNYNGLGELNSFASEISNWSADPFQRAKQQIQKEVQDVITNLNDLLNGNFEIDPELFLRKFQHSELKKRPKIIENKEVHINIEKLEKLLKYELQQFNLQQFDISRSKDKIAIISEKQIIVWDSNFPNTPCTLVNQSDDNYKSIVFTQDQQKLLVSNDDGELCLFQIKQNESTFKLLSKEKTQLKGRNSIHFYHLQNQFLIGGRENIQLWKFIANENKMKQEQVLNWIKNVYHITISNNDEYIGICSITDNYFIILENLEEYFKIKRQDDDDDGFFTLRFYNDSKKFITFSQKLTITIWSLNNKQIQNQYTIQSSFNGTLGYCSMIIEQFDKLLIIYENVNSAILIINLETMKELKKINPKEELKQIELLNDNTIIGMSSQELIQYKI